MRNQPRLNIANHKFDISQSPPIYFHVATGFLDRILSASFVGLILLPELRMSHSKRNTSRAVFTSHERTEAKRAWGQTTARLSRESMLPFASCRLCLERADDPVACPHGDIFCRECALSNILAQKKEIKRLQKVLELEAKEKDEDAERRDAEARERAVREFERVQSGIGSGAAEANGTAAHKGGNTNATSQAEEQSRPTKRKFEIDEEELLRIATQDRAKARKALDDEVAAKPKLPSFWTPSITPTSNTKDTLHNIVKKTKSTPICPGSPEDSPHSYSLAALVTVHFTEEEEEAAAQRGGGGRSKTKQRICPSCKRGLSNASKAMLAKPCGHVVCRSCVDKFMRPKGYHDPHAEDTDPEGLRCHVCDADLVDRTGRDEKTDKSKKKSKDKEKSVRPGLVEIRSEGTGFSAAGGNEVRKISVAFQC
ncbi:hypothetical protein BX600DRAFT_459732 [Xylariales sp. PMI_506]|nr:hypothetical protein BX600DRAFT_459732 [Xylariales sp. PMI_506]